MIPPRTFDIPTAEKKQGSPHEKVQGLCGLVCLDNGVTG